MKISVIMPSFLGHYEGAAKDRKIKLARSIQSFLKQDYQDKELIVVADGCSDTIEFIKNNYSDEPDVKTFFIEKQELFSGFVRTFGLTKATGDIICYLDNDDQFNHRNHLSQIIEGFADPKIQWIYFNDFIKYFVLEHLPMEERKCNIVAGEIGTSNIAHRNLPEITWQNCNGYGHDYSFVKLLQSNYPDYKKISGPSYLVCHIPNSVDT